MQYRKDCRTGPQYGDERSIYPRRIYIRVYDESCNGSDVEVEDGHLCERDGTLGRIWLGGSCVRGIVEGKR